jgi:hypothetical protein
MNLRRSSLYRPFHSAHLKHRERSKISASLGGGHEVTTVLR